MKAMVIEAFGDNAPLKEVQLPTPEPLDDEVLICLQYSAINPVDWKIRSGLLQSRMPFQFPIILGWDAAGTIAACGKNATRFKPGTRVFAYCKKPTIQWGTYAEYVVVKEKNVALMPQTASFQEAASIPLAGLTAWQSLLECGLQKGQTILIHAGAGGVGSLAIQFAKHIGATVITTASKKNEAYLKSLGADLIIDYTAEDFVSVCRKHYPNGIDAVFDTMGGETAQKSLSLLRPQGHFVSLLEHIESTPAFHSSYVFVQPNGAQLAEIAALFDQKKVKAPLLEEIHLRDVEKGLAKVKEGHVRGKIVINCQSLQSTNTG